MLCCTSWRLQLTVDISELIRLWHQNRRNSLYWICMVLVSYAVDWLRKAAVSGWKNVGHLAVGVAEFLSGMPAGILYVYRCFWAFVLTAHETTTIVIRLRIDVNSTAIRPRYYDHRTTCITTGLLHCGLNKQIGQRDCGLRVSGPCYVTMSLMSNARRTSVESNSNPNGMLGV